jgi:hypothetical protein
MPDPSTDINGAPTGSPARDRTAKNGIPAPLPNPGFRPTFAGSPLFPRKPDPARQHPGPLDPVFGFPPGDGPAPDQSPPLAPPREHRPQPLEADPALADLAAAGGDLVAARRLFARPRIRPRRTP